MKQAPAVTWIRDGVLIDRMPENATAFAVASYKYINENSDITLEDLINWCFENSGVSAEIKMQILNRNNPDSITDIQSANNYYVELAEAIGPYLKYFEGAPQLITELTQKGVSNYITSAIRQDVLDLWAKNEQGILVSKSLEILGDGENGMKGEGHFNHIRESKKDVQIYSVADAPSEIADSAKYSDVPIGFAHVITRQRVMDAFYRVKYVSQKRSISYKNSPESIDIDQIVLPEKELLIQSLEEAGATKIITGDKDSIISNLQDYFEEVGVL